MKFKKFLAFLIVSALATGMMAIPASADDTISLALMAVNFDVEAGAYVNPSPSGTPVRITGDGNYVLTIPLPAATVAEFDIADSRQRFNASGTSYSAARVREIPAAWSDVTIDITGATLNGDNLPIRSAERNNIAMNTGAGIYAQLWNAWWAPSQRISAQPDTATWGATTEFWTFESATPATITVSITVKGLGGSGGNVGGGDDTPAPPPPPAGGDDCAEFSTTTALAVLRAAVGLDTVTADMLKYFDLDGDGEITTADALLILRIAVGIDPAPDDCCDDC